MKRATLYKVETVKLSNDRTHEVLMQEPKTFNSVRTINNLIYFYDLILDLSVLQLKLAICNLNKTFDLTQVLMQGLVPTWQPVIRLHIATNGGCAYSSMHLYDFISNNKYKINTYIDGFAASGGSLMFLAGKKRFMSLNSFILIHQLSTWFQGTFALLLDKMLNATKTMLRIKNIYLKLLNITKELLELLLKKDLWLNIELATKYGFLRT